MTQNIYLVHEGADLAVGLQRALDNGQPVTPLNAKKALSVRSAADDVIVISAGKDWNKAVQILTEIQKDKKPFYAIVSSAAMLRKTMTQIEDPRKRLGSKDKPLARGVVDHKKEEPNLDELIEKKLARFVNKIRQSEGKNLYDLLIQEVEKPLIKLALKETDGNQVQASQLLGLHRNTLRKKMKDLKITSAKISGRS